MTQTTFNGYWVALGSSTAYTGTNEAGREALIDAQLSAIATSPGWKTGWWPLIVAQVAKLIKAIRKWIDDHFGNLSAFNFAAAFDEWCAEELGVPYWLPEV